MAQRRMFSPDIVCSDAFLEMPVSSRDLYVQLGMKADDDGFISPRGTMRMLGASEDDLKVLIAKRFVLPFESGVVVIKHWLIHNLLRADLYKETLYKKEKSTIGLNANGAYTELREGVSPIKPVEAPKWLKERRGELRTANVPQTALRIGQGREGKITAKAELVEEVHSKEDSPLEDALGDSKSPRIGGDKKKAYDELIKWSEKERGFPFLRTHILKQYKAFKIANENGITRDQLIAKWEEMSCEKFWMKNGFDWMNVIEEFNKKPV